MLVLLKWFSYIDDCLIFTSLGISLRSDRDQSGCEVRDIVPGGAVELDRRIAVGDHILSVNDQSLVGMNHQQVK